MANSSQVGDIGTKITLNCVEDISTSTAWIIKYKKPDGTIGQWTAIYEATTSIYYVTEEDALDQAGRWTLQAYVELGSTWIGRGEVGYLSVMPNI